MFIYLLYFSANRHPDTRWSKNKPKPPTSPSYFAITASNIIIETLADFQILSEFWYDVTLSRYAYCIYSIYSERQLWAVKR